MTKAKRDKELLNFTIIRFSDIDLDGLFFFVTGPQMVSHFFALCVFKVNCKVFTFIFLFVMKYSSLIMV